MVELANAEVPFVLPRGYLDAEGVNHREGVMRLATAYDEIAPLKPAEFVILQIQQLAGQTGT